jgi:hypothetical protein
MICFSVWWSRRNDNSQSDCDFDLDYENPSLAAKICGRKTIVLLINDFSSLGYCFAKCQQQFGACLLAHIKEVSNESLDLCQKKSVECEKRCFNDKRTSRIAEANWAKVVKVLHRYNTLSSIEEKQPLENKI